MTQNIVELKVDGMNCNNCAMSIAKHLEQKGLEDVFVSFQTCEVRYQPDDSKLTKEQVVSGIQQLGFIVDEEDVKPPFWTLERKLLISAFFTAPLLIGHLLMAFGLHIAVLENPWVQLALTIPPFVIGFLHFGRSGLSSLRGGVPNMDVLIFMGSTAAFVYSVTGLVLQNPNYYFFETAATIITLVLLGNWLEHRAVEQTTTAIGDLTKLKAETAKRILSSGATKDISTKNLRVGFKLQVNEGDKIPADGIIISGEGQVDESLLTGESEPVFKVIGGNVVGASILVSGNLQMEVTATGKDSVLEQIIELVKTAQTDKPPIQQLADRISAIFVPAVLGIAILTFVLGYFVFDITFQKAMMNAIAVMVISCPCAMGLATPTAVMVGVGRLAKNGILIKGGRTVEQLAGIKQMVFDKTGTLTTGAFKVEKIEYHNTDESAVHAAIYQMEQHSSHPIAKSLVTEMELKERTSSMVLSDFEEIKGEGIKAKDTAGNTYLLGSKKILSAQNSEHNGDVFLMKNDELWASISITDTLKSGAEKMINEIENAGINTIILSGDRQEKNAENS